MMNQLIPFLSQPLHALLLCICLITLFLLLRMQYTARHALHPDAFIAQLNQKKTLGLFIYDQSAPKHVIAGLRVCKLDELTQANIQQAIQKADAVVIAAVSAGLAEKTAKKIRRQNASKDVYYLGKGLQLWRAQNLPLISYPNK